MVTCYNALRNTYSGARMRTRTLSCGVLVALHLAAGCHVLADAIPGIIHLMSRFWVSDLQDPDPRVQIHGIKDCALLGSRIPRA